MRLPDQNKARPSIKELATATLSPRQLYVLVAAVLVLVNARLFYGSLKMQTEHVDLWFDPNSFRPIVDGIRKARWSAPLDDVFIHFDFARATARGYPFEWIAGNGYSSGGTSLLYPFVLSLGYLAGLTDLNLNHWAAIVACVCTFGTLLGVRRMFCRLPSWAALFAPPAMLAVGALNWTLFSGMEVALFLCLWAGCLVLWDDLMGSIEKGAATRVQALLLGVSCSLLVAARPEAAPLVAVFGVWSAISWQRRNNTSAALWTVVLVGLPGALVMIAHLTFNKILTGDSAAAGALAKLEMHHPYFTQEQVFDSWIFFFKYQILRLSDYHFSSIPLVGYLIWPLAVLSIVFQATRRYGILLWISILSWFALTALNGQVRWQNERYTMPATCWILLAAALGMGAGFSWSFEKGRNMLARAGVSILIGTAAITFVVGQSTRFRDQVWFFGRASRNILEQHVRAATFLKTPEYKFRRVLLSDAGALPFISDLPAIDLIGLGGYGRLPIAGASRQGVGAAIELMAYVPPSDLPNVMALYPSWWADFVLWFGHPVKDFSVRGNVICGGASKVIYIPKWGPILHSNAPFALLAKESVVDSLDVADILSEKGHRASWSRPTQGYVGMKMLPDPRSPKHDLWDAGRLLSTGMSLDFDLAKAKSNKASLLIRVAPAANARLSLNHTGGEEIITELKAADHWQEIRIPLGERTQSKRFSLKLIEGEAHIYHIFLVEPAP